MQLPGASALTLDALVGVVRELAAGHPLVEQVLGCTDADLPTALPQGPFDEFYYAHDVTGVVCRQLAKVNPKSRKICIGDAFGMLYTAGTMASYRRAPSFRERLLGWLRPAEEPASIRPDAAALVLPVDPSGRGLSATPLIVCRKESFLEAIRFCHANAADLRAHMRALLERTGTRKRYLLLTENYADAGLVAREREIEMYAAIAQRFCEPGSAIVVKPHPLESAGRAQELARALGPSYAVESVDPRFARYPIEIWLELLQACTVVCMAYPMLSLKYAHDIDVVNPLDDEFVERWMEPAYRQWMRDSLRLYREPLARLSTWSGDGLLWTGRA